MNPFTFGTVASGENFYDRKEECSRIINTLTGGNNIVLYAPRRYGKTSLVHKVMELLEDQNYKCIYIDFMKVFSRESFVKQFSHKIMEKQGNLSRAVSFIATLLKGITPQLNFNKEGIPEFSIAFKEYKLSDTTIEEIIDLPEKLGNIESKYIIVMDEFQEITNLNGENFEKILRSHIQFHKNVNYLFLGSKTHLLNDMFSNQNRAFYNSAMTIQIDKLPIDESINYLQNKFSIFNITLSKQNAEYMINKAGNIPYYIQMLAAEIWQYFITEPAEIQPEIIDKSADRIIDLKYDFYLKIFENLSAYQKKLLSALAIDSNNIYSLEYQQKHRLSSVSTTQKAVKALIDEYIIDKVENTYTISDPFFKEFLHRFF